MRDQKEKERPPAQVQDRCRPAESIPRTAGRQVAGIVGPGQEGIEAFMRKQSGYVYRRGDWWVLRYRADVIVNGQIVRKQLAHQLEQVAPKHERLKRPPTDLVTRAEDWLRDKQRKPATLATIGGFVEAVYLKFVEKQKRPSTLKGYRDMWKQHWLPRCGNVLMRDVRTCDVQGWLDSIAEDVPLSRQTMKHLKSLLSGIFAHAKRQGYFDGVNPVTDTAIPPSAEAGETYAYTLEEITGMLMRIPEPARTIVAVAAYTGARRGEIRGMCWENLHDGAKHIRQGGR
jgi:hypothetical protein